MKKIKAIIIAIILIPGFVLQCETFQQQLGNFTSAYYLTTEISFQDEKERVEMLRELERYAKEEQVTVFAGRTEMVNSFRFMEHFYGDSLIKPLFEKQHGVSEGVYRSVMSGETGVVFHEFAALAGEENRHVRSFSFIGEDAAVFRVYEKMLKNHELTSPSIINGTEADLICAMWGLIAGILLLLNCIETAFRKKEVTVRVSMGEGVWGIILKSAGLEILADLLEFFLLRAVVFRFVSGEYMGRTVFLLYCAGVFLSCLVYLSYADYDIRRAFSNADEPKTVLALIYVIKVVVTTVSIVLLVTNLHFLVRDLRSSNQSAMLGDYGGYSYLYFEDENWPMDTDESSERYDMQVSFYNELYRDHYETVKPAVCVHALTDMDRKLDYVLVNEFAQGMMGDFGKGLDYDRTADAVFFIPEDFAGDRDVTGDAQYCLSGIVADTEKLHTVVVFYGTDRYFTCVNQNASGGLETFKNPVVVFSRYDGAAHRDNLSLGTDYSSVMYCLSGTDAEDAIGKLPLGENGFKLVQTGVRESSEYHNSLLRKAIAFLSSVCVLTLLLQAVLVVSIVSMEYRFRAMELALKKIFAYSIWERNRGLFLVSALSNAVTTLGLSIAGTVTGLYSALTCLWVGAFVLAMELAVIVVNILRVEAKNIQKILKGGCL